MNSRIFLPLISIAFHISLSAQTPYNSNADAQNLDLTSGYHHLIGNHLECKDSYFHEDAEVHLESATGITILPNTKINNISSGNHFKATIGNVMNVADMLGNWNPDKFEKFELGVSVPSNVNASIQDYFNTGTGLNPYNPNEVSVECYFVGPSGIPHVRHGFFYRDFTVNNTTNGWTELPTIYSFRVRFSPPEAGLYSFQVNCKVSNQSVSLFSGTFMVNNSSDPGFLEMSNGGDRKLRFQNGQIFFAIGQNIPYAMDPMNVYQCGKPLCGADAPAYNQQRNFMLDLANNGGNFVRIRMDPWSNPIISTERSVFPGDPAPKPQIECIYNYDHNQRHMWELDRTFDFCTEHDLYIMLCLFQDQYWSISGSSDWANVNNWADNPFSALLGTSEQGLMNFFSDPASEEYFKRVLYYIQARWGYSTHLAIWELGNEVDNIGNTSQGKLMLTNSQFQSTVNTWLCNMSAYLESNFDGNYFYPWHPLTIGCADNRGYTYSDCVNIWSKNSYTTNISGGDYDDANYNNRFNMSRTDHYMNYKPFIFGELGTNCTWTVNGQSITEVADKFNDREFHNSIWATSMMGGIGTGLYWNDWEESNNLNHRKNFKALANFLSICISEDLFAREYHIFKSKDEAGNEEIRTYYLVSDDEERIIGWTQNRSSWWFNEVPDPSSPNFYLYSDMKNCTGSSAFPASPFDCQDVSGNPEIIIHADGNLNLWRNYFVRVYKTYDEGGLIDSRNETVTYHPIDLFPGTSIRFRENMPFGINDQGNYPDYAFIMYAQGSYRMKDTTIDAVETVLENLDNNNENNSSESKNNLIFYFPELNSIKITEGPQPILAISIYDILGRCRAIFDSNERSLNISSIPTGLFLIKIKYLNDEKIYKLFKTN